MKKNNVKIGNKVLKLGYTRKKTEYLNDMVLLGKKGSMQEVKTCEIVRADARNNCSQITLTNGLIINDHRCLEELALLLPYNHFGYYRVGCLFCMYRILSFDSKAMTVKLDNQDTIKIESRKIFKRFDEDYYLLNR